MVDRSKTAYTCLHCGELYASLAGKVCKYCNTPEKRAAMDAENTEIQKKLGLKFFCSYCEQERRKGGERK